MVTRGDIDVIRHGTNIVAVYVRRFYEWGEPNDQWMCPRPRAGEW